MRRTVRSPVASLINSGGAAMAATLVLPGKQLKSHALAKCSSCPAFGVGVRAGRCQPCEEQSCASLAIEPFPSQGGCEQSELSLLCCGSTSMIPAAKLWNKFLATGCSMMVYPWVDTCCLLGFKTMHRNCRGTSKCLQSCWCLEKPVLVSWKCHAVAWHHGLYEIWRQACRVIWICFKVM